MSGGRGEGEGERKSSAYFPLSAEPVVGLNTGLGLTTVRP